MSEHDFSQVLGLPYVLANQSQKHVTVNESLRLLDGLIQLSVIDRDITTPPSDPAEGDRYMIAAGATGAWTGHDGDIAFFADGGWLFLPPRTGWRAWIEDESRFLVCDGSHWRETTAAELQNLTRLGVGAEADANNPLLVKLNALLFTALETANGGTGDLRAKLNKESSANVLSLLFQTGFSGRAEMGLTGDDDFLFKVSPDGSVFHEALRINRETGRVSLPASFTGEIGTMAAEAAADYTPTSGLGAAALSNDYGDLDNLPVLREVLTANRTYYVNASTGSDSNDGLSSGTAFLTLQKAIDAAYAVDTSVYTIDILVAAGTYSTRVILNGPNPGNGIISLKGDTADPTNCTLSNNTPISAGGGATLHLEGFQFIGSGTLVSATTNATIRVTGPCIFAGGGVNFSALDNGVVRIESNYTLTASKSRNYSANRGGIIFGANIDCTIVGTLTFSSQFALAQGQGQIVAGGATFSGDAALTTGKRYAVVTLGLIATNGGGANFFPGDVAGTEDTGGIYV